MGARADQTARAVVLVANAKAGQAGPRVEQAKAALRAVGLRLVEQLAVDELERLPRWLERAAGDRPLVVAAGGDGTVGAVSAHLANQGAVLGILPLGTANDFARSLGIPMDVGAAVRLLTEGQVATVDVGAFTAAGAPPRYFVQAATMGVGVDFARLAAQQAVRRRWGKLTYVAATALALRTARPFACDLRPDGEVRRMRLVHLAVLNAPVFGGVLGLTLPESELADRRLDVLIVEARPWPLLVLAALPLLLGRRPRRRGVRVGQARTLAVHVEQALAVSLDGEVAGELPGSFYLAAKALRVVTPRT